MRTATFESTVDILVKAYFNGTLAHRDCGCAVHNLIESVAGGKVVPLWTSVFCTYVRRDGSLFRKFFMQPYETESDVKNQIDSTGYSVHDLAAIEYAFEKDRDKNDIFLCLMNVVDQLSIIHNVDLSIKENAKLLFVKTNPLC